MRGITDERLMVFKEHCQNQSDLELYEYLLTRCKELNPWKPIESASLGKQLRLYSVYGVQIDGQLVNEEERKLYTHWQELPEDPTE